MAEADRLIADCVASGEFVSDMPPRALRPTLGSAIHRAAVIRLRKRLPAYVEPDRFAADTLDAALRAVCVAANLPALAARAKI